MPLSSSESVLIDVVPSPMVSVTEAVSIKITASVHLNLNLRPANSPDVVLIGFAGHCGPCCRVSDTWGYLNKAGNETGYVETAQSVVDTLTMQGLEVEYFNASSFVKSHESRLSNSNEQGYLEAQAFLDFVRENWVEGFDNPSRIMLLVHSHGTVWATLLAMNNLDLTFDYFIYLDAICWQFWAKHKGFIKQAFADLGQTLPFPLDQGDPCSSFKIPNYWWRQDISDVVPANVIYALEVRSALQLMSLSPNVVRDDQANMRINGTKLGIFTVESLQGHTRVNERYGVAMGWVNRMIEVLGLPDHSEYAMEDFVLPPAPEGFDHSKVNN